MNANAMRGHVSVIDDDEAVRDALSALLNASDFQVEAYANAEAFLTMGLRRNPDCLILDVRMPGMTGLELQDELRKREVSTPIIMLTAHGDVPMAVRAIQNRADDFIQKPVSSECLLAAIDKSLRRGRAIKMRATSSKSADKLKLLSARERQVLDLVVGGAQSSEFAEQLCISIKTVEFHRANIRATLGVSSLQESCLLVFNSST